MKQLKHLLIYDFILLQRNKIIGISLAVTALYTGAFQGLAMLGDMEKLLILVIFNDPALLGFLFVGVMVLFEKNENTLQALAVSPMEIQWYILSKASALTLISLFCCFAMAFATKGFDFQYIHYAFASMLTTYLFSFIGFMVVAGESIFNNYILKALGVILLLSTPFLGYFDVLPAVWFVLFPTQPAIDLYQISFEKNTDNEHIIYTYTLLIFWTMASYFGALKLMKKNLSI
jgi:fluoroquinolone transport system permease protein